MTYNKNSNLVSKKVHKAARLCSSEWLTYKKTPNGTYYYKRKIPSYLIELLGKQEIKLSLKTKDPIVAQTSAKRLTSKLGIKWQNIRAVKPLLTEVQELVSALGTTQTYAEVVHGHGESTYDKDAPPKQDKIVTIYNKKVF